MNWVTLEDTLKIITFRVGDEEYGINIMQVQEIVRIMESVKVPKAPQYVEGIINLRGKIIPVIDLRKKLNKAITPYTDSSKIIIADTGHRLSGLIVDEVIDVTMLTKIENCPYLNGEKKSEYIMGIGKKDDRLISILDLDNILRFKM